MEEARRRHHPRRLRLLQRDPPPRRRPPARRRARPQKRRRPRHALLPRLLRRRHRPQGGQGHRREQPRQPRPPHHLRDHHSRLPPPEQVPPLRSGGRRPVRRRGRRGGDRIRSDRGAGVSLHGIKLRRAAIPARDQRRDRRAIVGRGDILQARKGLAGEDRGEHRGVLQEIDGEGRSGGLQRDVLGGSPRWAGDTEPAGGETRVGEGEARLQQKGVDGFWEC